MYLIIKLIFFFDKLQYVINSMFLYYIFNKYIMPGPRRKYKTMNFVFTNICDQSDVISLFC